MPFKSEAQRRYFYAANRRGEISDKDLKKWEDATPKDKDLPERLHKKAFWQGFNKQAIEGGGKGFDAQGEGAIRGGLSTDRIQGSQQSHGRGGEDTRTDKELLDRERNPRDFQVGNQGPVLEADSVPIQF
jgi:hypothetical protein